VTERQNLGWSSRRRRRSEERRERERGTRRRCDEEAPGCRRRGEGAGGVPPADGAVAMPAAASERPRARENHLFFPIKRRESRDILEEMWVFGRRGPMVAKRRGG